MPSDLTPVSQRWHDAWPRALEAWSSFTRLHRPTLCTSREDVRREGLSGSFAMIRLVDHTIVIDLREVVRYGVEDFATEILAHEIGHHVYVPANLADNARLLACMRESLPTFEQHAPLIANLYADLLLNDRLQRDVGLDMAGVYKHIVATDGFPADDLFRFYFRTYEVLWSLPSGTLVQAPFNRNINLDAALCARLVRAYRKDWLNGAGRFGALCLDYFMAMMDGQAYDQQRVRVLLDSVRAGEGLAIPDGLIDISPAERDGVVHPYQDPALTGDHTERPAPSTRLRELPETEGGQKNNYRAPHEYVDLMRSLGVQVDARDVVIQYYKERARPHLIKFPTRSLPESLERVMEGVEPWELGAPVSRIDWLESLIKSPHVIPGVTTVERSYGLSPGTEPQHRPMDLYLGIDCSGSMENPAIFCSFPVVAGAVMVTSAIRAGAHVMTVLSGEPGEYAATRGFSRSERDNLRVLTSYLGTGYGFGIERLKQTFIDQKPPERPCHILVITDSDIFLMLGETPGGWEIARQAAEIAGSGATMLLEIRDCTPYKSQIRRLHTIGWQTHIVTEEADVVDFARAFSRKHFEREDNTRRAPFAASQRGEEW